MYIFGFGGTLKSGRRAKQALSIEDPHSQILEMNQMLDL